MNGETIYRNRWKILVLLVIVFLAVPASFFIFSEEESDEKLFVNRSAYIVQRGTGETRINISEFSGEEARVQKKASGSYMYEEGRYMTEFTYLGIYRGDVFSKVKKEGGNPVMVLTDDFDAYDGTVNSYMTSKVVERNGSEMLQTNIYVDRDFREFVEGELYVIWGGNWENYRPFRFKEVAPNVYMDTVYDNDTSRMVHGASTSDANFAVGTFSPEEVREKDTDIRAAVFMK